jgi:hypothetical protein
MTAPPLPLPLETPASPASSPAPESFDVPPEDDPDDEDPDEEEPDEEEPDEEDPLPEPPPASLPEPGDDGELDEHAAATARTAADPIARRIRWLRMDYRLRSAPGSGHVPIG